VRRPSLSLAALLSLALALGAAASTQAPSDPAPADGSDASAYDGLLGTWGGPHSARDVAALAQGLFAYFDADQALARAAFDPAAEWDSLGLSCEGLSSLSIHADYALLRRDLYRDGARLSASVAILTMDASRSYGGRRAGTRIVSATLAIVGPGGQPYLYLRVGPFTEESGLAATSVLARREGQRMAFARRDARGKARASAYAPLLASRGLNSPEFPLDGASLSEGPRELQEPDMDALAMSAYRSSYDPAAKTLSLSSGDDGTAVRLLYGEDQRLSALSIDSLGALFTAEDLGVTLGQRERRAASLAPIAVSVAASFPPGMGVEDFLSAAAYDVEVSFPGALPKASVPSWLDSSRFSLSERGFAYHYRAGTSPWGAWDESSRAECLAPEPLIEADDPDIKSLAARLGAGKSDRQAALDVAKWVASHLSYDSSVLSESAAWALRERRGDCSEFAALSVALLRAAGIPSRMVVGFYIQGDGNLVGHAWAIALVEGSWLALEPTRGLAADLRSYLPYPLQGSLMPPPEKLVFSLP
jgi:hypothetical protein